MAVPVRHYPSESSKIVEVHSLLSIPNQFFGATEAEVVEQLTRMGADAPPLYGQFAILHTDDEHIWLIRDRLGLNKLFYVLDRNRGVLTVGNSIFEVATATGDFNQIASVLPGHFLKINRESFEKELTCYYDISREAAPPAADFDLGDFQRRVSQRLSDYFTHLHASYPEATFAVCLSGGLDSTLIATYAKRYLKNVLAATFSYSINSRESEDFVAARAIADALDLEFVPIVKERRLEEGRLITVLRHCQDWRDFNVHCAWLNDHVAEELRQRYPDRQLIALTGDLMNEYVADYTPVTYGGVVHYPQPRISRERLRRFFIYGLDTSDREIGVFHRQNITVLQPYSFVAEEYLRIPAQVIEQPQSKEVLNLPLIANDRVKGLVGRAKTRAQVGGPDGGTLGLFHDAGISQSVLKTSWDELFTPFCREGKPREIIVSGRYRSAV